MQLFHLWSQWETNSLLPSISPAPHLNAANSIDPATGGGRAHGGCRVICRYFQSTKSSGLSSNLQPTGAKADHLREEMEEAANRMEICRVSPQLPSRHISPDAAVLSG